MTTPLAPSITPLRVLHVIVGLDVGGAERMLSRLIDANRDGAGLHHSVISLTDIGPVGQELQRDGVAVQALGMRGVPGMLTGLWRLCRVIRAQRPDIVQTWMYHADFLGGLAARANCCHVVWGVRATDVRAEGVRKTIWLRRLCAILSHWLPDRIICAAEASRRAHLEIGYAASRLIVIGNGFDVTALAEAGADRDAARVRLGLAADAFVVGTVGRFNPVKDYASFVAAAAQVAQAAPEARFVMVGRGLDRDNAELTGWIAQTGLVERFTLLGERSDVPACLAALDVFCLSSRSEGFPNVVGEAMATSVPCVVTDVGDAAMLVGETGIVAPIADPGALAAALLRVYRLTALERRELGRAAQHRIESRYSMATVRRQFAATYRALVPSAREVS